jgi:AcrR family transcriptional regulator
MAHDKSQTPVPRRRKAVQERSVDTVAVILEGAARVFDREGYAATTNRIAKEAGVGIGSIYEYFPNKEALLLALGEKHLGDVEAALAPWLDAQEQREPEAVLRGLLETILELHRKHPRMHDTLSRVAAQQPQLAQRAAALETTVVDVLAHALESRLGPTTARLRARIVVSTVGHLTHDLIVSESDPAVAKQLAQETERMCLSFMKA